MKKYNTIKTNKELDGDFVKQIILWCNFNKDKYFKRNRQIIQKRYVEEKTLKEIALEFNITKERVRQIINEIMKKLSTF